MDVPEARENLLAFTKRYPDREVIAVSAKEKKGIEDLKIALDRWLHATELNKSEAVVSYAKAVL